MRIATLDLTPDLFLGICTAFKNGPPRRFIVKESPLPVDAEIVRIGPSPDRPDVLRLYIQSASFAEVGESAEPPQLPDIIFETVSDSFDQERQRLDDIRGCDECYLCDEHGDYVESESRKHTAVDKYHPVCIHCGLADIAGDWEIYPCNDEWKKVIAING